MARSAGSLCRERRGSSGNPARACRHRSEHDGRANQHQPDARDPGGMERATCALEKSLREAEGEDAWDFAQCGPNADLRLRVERQLKSELAGRSLRLDVLTKATAAWAQGPIANRKVTPARSGYARV